MEKKRDISLITPTQASRYENLLLLKKMILEQTFLEKIKEWIIVDGSHVYDEIFEKNVLQLQNNNNLSGINLIYIPFEKDCNVGRLRNKANDIATGDIIICMDDDDFYPTERVEHAYESLQKSECLIAGCSASFMYDFVIDVQFQFHPFGVNHSVNNAFTYKKEYLKNHKHDETVKHGEEKSFTNNFTEKMYQLDPHKTVNISSHTQNTYSKREMILNFFVGRHQQMKIITNEKIFSSGYYQKMRKIFIKTDTSVYDIVYLCGGFCPMWSPMDTKIGGSEQAVKHLSENFAKKGFKVAVFAAVDDCICNNVDYINWKKFPYHEKFKIIIAWRHSGIMSLFFKKVVAQQIVWDLHDNVAKLNQSVELHNAFLTTYGGKSFDKIMFKSHYHKEEYEKLYKVALNEKKEYAIIPNGLRVEEFKDILKTAPYRDPYRFVYCSCYTRGLTHILRYVWPEIVTLESKAELHVYYGMDFVHDLNFRNEIYQLFAVSKNVMNHEKQPLDIIAAEKCKSTFHLYLSNTAAEIDCISIRESVLCGCVPIISNFGVFKERIGHHIDIPLNEAPNFIEEMKKAGVEIGNLLHDTKAVAKLRKDIKNILVPSSSYSSCSSSSSSKELLDDWSETSIRWIQTFSK